MKKLTLEDLSGAFFILAVGVASSLVVFLMEQVVWRCTGSNAKWQRVKLLDVDIIAPQISSLESCLGIFIKFTLIYVM